jgi:hypothetical protein
MKHELLNIESRNHLTAPYSDFIIQRSLSEFTIYY